MQESEEQTERHAVQVVAESLDKSQCGPQSIEKRDPDRAIKILYMLAQRTPIAEIATTCGVCENTIRSIKERQNEALKFLNDRARLNTATVADMLVNATALKAQKLLEDPDHLNKTNIKDIALATGIMTDKAAVHQGRPTNITENRGSENREKLMELIKQAKERMAKAKVIDVEQAKQ